MMKHDQTKLPMIFLRIGWMNRYQGQTALDKIDGGGAFVRERGHGHEIFNFQPFNGYVYGYVQPPRAGYNDSAGSGINLGRVGTSADGNSVSGLLAVWVARSLIVGWYADAMIYRYWQPPPPGANRRYDREDFGYYVKAKASNATLLSPDERTFSVPRGANGMGQSNVWYADNPQVHRQLRSDVLEYLTSRRVAKQTENAGKDLSRQSDPLIRQKVEGAAIQTVTAHYASLGYSVTSCEGDNVGWDLDAVHPTRDLALKVEVKGLSGADGGVELTPNEYAKMKQHQDSYRVCIVTKALTIPSLAIYAYSRDSGHWEDQSARALRISEVIAARCYPE